MKVELTSAPSPNHSHDEGRFSQNRLDMDGAAGLEADSTPVAGGETGSGAEEEAENPESAPDQSGSPKTRKGSDRNA